VRAKLSRALSQTDSGLRGGGIDVREVPRQEVSVVVADPSTPGVKKQQIARQQLAGKNAAKV
jgi:hypothetical protein